MSFIKKTIINKFQRWSCSGKLADKRDFKTPPLQSKISTLKTKPASSTCNRGCKVAEFTPSLLPVLLHPIGVTSPGVSSGSGRSWRYLLQTCQSSQMATIGGRRLTPIKLLADKWDGSDNSSNGPRLRFTIGFAYIPGISCQWEKCWRQQVLEVSEKKRRRAKQAINGNQNCKWD